MNRAETAQLLAMVQAFDRRTVGESDVLAWADVLHDIDHADAAQAVRDHYRDSHDWLMPADVRKRVKAIRDDRLRAIPTEPPDHEITDHARSYIASLQGNIRRIADGYALPRGIERAEPPEEITTRTGRADRRIRSLPYSCPWCHASAGDRCVNALGDALTSVPAHDARLVAAGIAQWSDGPYQHAVPTTEENTR